MMQLGSGPEIVCARYTTTLQCTVISQLVAPTICPELVELYNTLQ